MSSSVLDTRYNAPPRRRRVALCPPPWSRRMLRRAEQTAAASPKRVVARAREELAAELGIGASRVVLTASGSDALLAALRMFAAERPLRREVVLSTWNCPNVLCAVLAAGLFPVLVDCDPHGRVDAAGVEKRVTSQTLAVLATNGTGTPDDMATLRAATGPSVTIIDDAAQAWVAGREHDRPSTRGDCGIVSFGRHKPLWAGGGGALVLPVHSEMNIAICRGVPGDQVAASSALRRLINANSVSRLSRALAVSSGMESPPDYDDALKSASAVRIAPAPTTIAPLHAALFSEQLGQLPKVRAMCIAHARRLAQALDENPNFVSPPAEELGGGAIPNFLIARVEPQSRHALAADLARGGVETTWLYPPLHLIVDPSETDSGAFPAATRLAARSLCLPCKGWHSERAIGRVVSAVRNCVVGAQSAREAG